MSEWLQLLIAIPSVLLIALGLWKASDALTRRGIVVRPVDGMDEAMTKIESRFANPATRKPASRRSPPKT